MSEAPTRRQRSHSQSSFRQAAVIGVPDERQVGNAFVVKDNTAPEKS
jgi:hypothetical protein